MPAIDYERAATLLAESFARAEKTFYDKQEPVATADVISAADIIFASSTQALREALLGCVLAKAVEPSVNVRHPYVSHGSDSFNGRTLDENVVNPFFQQKLVPCSKGPYLASFRRSVKFNDETRAGIRDKAAYDAFLNYLTTLERAKENTVLSLLDYLLFRFVQLRDAANITVLKISRLSLEQLRGVVTGLLDLESGGLVPVLLVVSMLRTIQTCYRLKWSITHQGINVSDKASGAVGDVTVTQDGKVLLAIEITERVIEKDRVVSTFNTKILTSGIEDYLFLYSSDAPANDAHAIARTYFSQGHEINFLPVADWLINNLATIGRRCREHFTAELVRAIDDAKVPAKVKLGWNNIVHATVGA
jgi:hypothetical protein